ncbi:MAG: hypothetical protein ACR2G5_01670 [Pyrinomonadaceae bacterium]
MNCQNFETIVNDLAREQIMEASVRERALAHHEECEACAQRLEDERALSFGLQALAAEMRSTEMRSVAASDRVEHLLVAFRSLGVAQGQPHETHHWRYWAAAAAVVLFVAFGIAGVRSRMGVPKLHEQAANETVKAHALLPIPISSLGSSNTAVLPLPKPALTARKNRGAKAPPARPRLQDGSEDTRGGKDAKGARDAQLTGNETLAANYTEREIVTDFLPVGYASPLSLQDGGQIVRVELPRSALASFGLPVNLNRANERVKADVLVGTDGQPRAIRFVQ